MEQNIKQYLLYDLQHIKHKQVKVGGDKKVALMICERVGCGNVGIVHSRSCDDVNGTPTSTLITTTQLSVLRQCAGRLEQVRTSHSNDYC